MRCGSALSSCTVHTLRISTKKVTRNDKGETSFRMSDFTCYVSHAKK
jgi:hypothetical protein